MEETVLRGQRRKKVGTRDAYDNRKQGWVPGNLYGHGKANVHFFIREEDITKAIREGHHMVTLELDGDTGQGLLKEIQFDTFGDRIIHVDFARISLDEVIETSVAVHTMGNPKGVAAGGLLEFPYHEIPVRGKARDVPESVEIDVSELQIGDQIRPKDVPLPAGVECLLGEEEPILLVAAPRGTEEPEEGEPGPTEPEVIGKKPEEGSEGDG